MTEPKKISLRRRLIQFFEGRSDKYLPVEIFDYFKERDINYLPESISRICRVLADTPADKDNPEGKKMLRKRLRPRTDYVEYFK